MREGYCYTCLAVGRYFGRVAKDLYLQHVLLAAFADAEFASLHVHTKRFKNDPEPLLVRKFRQEKEHKPKLFGLDIFRWGGRGLPREWGGGQKVRYVPRNPERPNFLAGYPEILPGYPGIARKG